MAGIDTRSYRTSFLGYARRSSQAALNSRTGAKLRNIADVWVRADLHNTFGRDNPRILVTLFVAIAVSLVSAHPWPGDDLLRDMVAWHYSYDYRNMFAYSPGIPTYDMYIGFDVVTGWVYRHFPWGSHQSGTFVVQCCATIAYLAAVTHAVIKRARSSDDKWFLTAALLVAVLLAGSANRLMLARPEIFLAAWAICATAIESRKGLLIWTAGGALLLTSYWMALAYLPLVATAKRPLWERGLAALTLLKLNLVFWIAYSHGAWLGTGELLRHSVATRLVPIGEDMPIALMLFSVPVDILLLSLAAATWHRFSHTQPDSERRRLFWELAILAGIIIWFLLPNMIRYADIVGPLLAIALATIWPVQSPLPWTALARGMVLLTATLLGFGLFQASDQTDTVLLQDPPTHVVLTPFGPPMYRLIFSNPGVVVAPAMEVGFSTVPVQHLTVDLNNGTLDCSALTRLKFTDVLEDSLKSIPPCATLEDISHTLRLWKLQPGPAAK